MKSRMLYGVLLVIGVLAIVTGLVLAQGSGGGSEDDASEGNRLGDNDPQSFYAGIPQSRGEDGAFTLGDPDAPVTIMEFADYLCGHCQTHHALTRQFIEEFVATGQAKFQFRFMPIIDDYYSPLLSAITECAYDQGAFWSTYDLIFDWAENGRLSSNAAEAVAANLNLDSEQLLACVSELGTRPFQFETDYALGNELGVTGTPAVRVQIGDGPMGAISLGGVVYSRGGAPLEVLERFVTSQNFEESFALVNQLRNDRYLPDDSIITGEPCGVPCWNGIVVGETTWDDAIAIIEADETLSTPQYRESESGPAKQATWGPVEGDPCCQMVTLDGETVAFLWLQLAPNHTLGELIATLGEPAYLTGARYTRDQAYASIYYPDHLVGISVFVAGEEDGVLSETSEIISVEYLSTERLDSVLTSTPMHAWEGYQSYSTYMGGEFELTPAEES